MPRFVKVAEVEENTRWVLDAPLWFRVLAAVLFVAGLMAVVYVIDRWLLWMTDCQRYGFIG